MSSITIIAKDTKVGFLDRFLSLWILVSMVCGSAVGILFKEFPTFLETSQAQVSLPVFVGLLLMLYPVFCKVHYENLLKCARKTASKYLCVSLILNWVVCPFIMLGLGWACLPDLPDHREGILLIGVARCIAMVLVWVDLADGDSEWCAILVAMNSLLQMLLFAPLAFLFTVVLGGTSSSSSSSIDMWPAVQNVLVFLGIPFAGGLLTRLVLRHPWALGARLYDTYFIKLVNPLALLGLLYTIFIMFALQGSRVVTQLFSVFRVSVPLFLYFTLVWTMTMCISKTLLLPWRMAVTQSFTAASNNFELALAIAVATYGADSHQALATTIGPLIEVPVMLSLVNFTPAVKKILAYPDADC